MARQGGEVGFAKCLEIPFNPEAAFLAPNLPTPPDSFESFELQ